MSGAPSAASPSRASSQETNLREFVAWHEWREPPDLEAADILQAAADAVKHGALSLEAADALIAVWAPFAGLESHVGNEPPTFAVAVTEEQLQRAVVADFRSMIARENNAAKRVYLTTLLDKQIRRFAEEIQ
jgi:hypothetical protein